MATQQSRGTQARNSSGTETHDFRRMSRRRRAQRVLCNKGPRYGTFLVAPPTRGPTVVRTDMPLLSTTPVASDQDTARRCNAGTLIREGVHGYDAHAYVQWIPLYCTSLLLIDALPRVQGATKGDSEDARRLDIRGPTLPLRGSVRNCYRQWSGVCQSRILPLQKVSY
jgi:hypothetical protein